MRTHRHPAAIAIIGMAFRFPGDLHDEASLWEALSTGRDLVDRVGEDRWAVDQLQHPKRAEPGRSITFSAGVLSDIDAFDAQFFGISPREAALLDPQQRILLELAWEAMENGGQIPAHLAGSDCAVYIGISGLDYGMRMLDDMASMTAHSMTGNTLSIAANRLSYFFDLRGPSMAVDTACSSSLAALHQACSSLQSGESSLALAGGVNLLLHPYPFIGFTKASMLSANGRCRVFDAAGDGYVRAEGGAVFLLKPLAKAETDGDSIRAVILASGMNADGGRKTSITIPSPEGQVELMRGVLQRAGLPADRVAYVEAHGTGTTVGDPIEARAIAEVYARRRQAPLLVGSVKSNLGHLEPASGMAGLVKTILALEHEALPPSLHCSVLNPAIDFVGLNLEVVTGYLPLRRDRRQPLVMGVNSFGFGGANAHVLLQAYRRGQDVRLWLGQPMPPLFLSARTPDALRALAGRYAGLLRSQDRAAYYDVAYCAAFCRQHLDKRLALKVSDPGAAVDLLDRFAKGEQPPEVVLEDAPPGPGAVAFVYSGNGSQWVGMGQRLLAESSRFSALIAELDAAIAPVAGFSILDALRADAASARLDDTAVAQPLLFAIQVAITRILREQGIAPAAVAGHSVGEVAAAWAAGALALDQAIDLICARSAAQALTRGDGRMAAVGLSAPDISEILRGYPTLELAGINGPSAVTIAGSLAELEALQARLAAKGTFFHLLDLDYAFHSRSMDEIRGHLLERLAELEPTSGTLAFVSTVAGDLLDGRSLTAGYWWDNVRRPVRFAQAMKTLIERGCRTFVEIGPHTILRRYMTDCLAAAEAMGHVIPSLRRNDDGAARLDEVALRVKLSETEPDLRPYFPSAGRFVRLPNYPWQRERHWHPQSSEAYSLLTRHRVHPLLGWRLREAEAAWENTLDPIVLPYLADHRVAGAVVLPAAAYVEMALAAARERFGGKRFELEGLDILTPVVFDDKHTRTLRFELSLRDGGFRILSRQRLSDDPWTLNAVGRLLGAPARPTPEAPVPLPEGDGEALDAAAHYRLTLALALEYGPAFQGFAGGSALREAIRGQIALPEALGLDVEGYLLHPAALDVCFQSLVHAFRAEIDAWQGLPLLPVRVGRLCYYGGGPAATFQCRVKRRSARSVAADFAVLDGESRVLAALEGCRFRAATLQRKAVAEPAEWGVAARLVPHRLDLSEPSLGPNRIWVDQARAWLVDAEPVLRRHDYLHAGLPLLDALVVAFAYGAFEELSETHAVWLQQALDQPETVPAERRTFFLWLVRCLREASLLREKAGIWHLDAANAPPPADDIWRALLADFPDALPELVFVGRVGRRLAGLIRADEPAQDLADAIQRSHLLETLFDGAPAYRAMNLALREILRAIGAAWPANRRLRILEISGGSSELPHQTQLPTDRLDYVIAHAEGQRLARLEAEHEPHPFVTVATLNEADLTLSAGPRLPDEFDLILVHHWLHRAPDLAAALGGVQRRLAPGGLLILAERYPDLSADCIFGVAPAWWQETAAGHASSLLRPSDWAGLLREAGLEDVETLVEPEAEGLAGGAYLLLARSPARSAAPVEAEPQSWLLLCGTAEASASLGTRLARALESQGQHVMLTREGGADSGFMTEDAESLRGLLATAASELGGIHHLVNLTAVSDEGEVPPIAQNGATDAHCLLTLHLAQAIATETWGQPRLWLVTSGGALVSEPAGNWRIDPLQAPLWGLGRVIMNELPALACTLIDLALDPASGEAAERLQNELLAPDGECEIVLAPQARFALRVRREQREPPDDAEETPPFRLDFQAPGQLRNLAWVPQGRPPLGPAEIEVRPAAVGLNFRDVMYAMGLLPDEAVENGFAGASLGLEFAGAVSRVGDGVTEYRVGDSVMGFGPACFASHLVTTASAVAPKPAEWTFAQAATVPTVFFTAYYALKHLAQLRPGERVLIHGGAGGVGIAAVQLARHFEAEVFATAGSEEKRDFVCLLGADHVLDSRSLAFADDILALTDDEGVDVVLNSLAGEAINRNLRVLKPFGRFLELGKRDFFENTPIGLRPFKDNISYFGIDADQLLVARPQLASHMFRAVMELFRDGALAPLPCRVFPAERVVEAFRYMQQSRHIGKVVVELAGARPSLVQPPTAAAPLTLGKESTYLVTGGLAGFGLEAARWLAERGAGHLVLMSRRGMATSGAADAVASIEAQGARVRVFACDVADYGALARALAQVDRELPPLRGVLHAAMVLDDGLLVNLDAERFGKVLKPKLRGAWNLHNLTLDRPLAHFILFSSVTTLIGNPGQANYVAANAYLEGLAAWRRARGLPATCIGFGPIGDAGYLTRNAAVKDGLASRLGAEPMSARQALRMLERSLLEDRSQIAVANFEWGVLARLLPSAGGLRFESLRRAASGEDAGGDAAVDIRSLIAGKTPEEVHEIVHDLVLAEVAQILSIGADRIDPARSLYDLGMDSLMAVELAAGMEKRFGVSLPAISLNEGPSVARIAARLADQLSGAAHEAAGDGVETLVTQMAAQHEVDLSAADLAQTAADVSNGARAGVGLIQ